MFCTMSINNKLYTIGKKKNKSLFNDTAYSQYLYKKKSYLHNDTHTHNDTQNDTPTQKMQLITMTH